MEEDSEAMRALLEVLARIAPDWSGKCPPVPTQLDISSPEGQMPVDRYLERQRPDAPISRAQMGGAGLRAFQAIAGEWGLALKEQLALLAVPATTYRRQKTAALAGKDVALAPSTFERLGIVLGIYKDLHILLPQHPAQWLRNPNSNPIFAGKLPLDRMLAGNVADLCAIRQYLDAWRGGPVDHYLSEQVVSTCNQLEAATTPYDSADYLKTVSNSGGGFRSAFASMTVPAPRNCGVEQARSQPEP